MKKYAFLLFGVLLVLGVLGLFLPDAAHAWGWGGGGGGGGWRPPSDRPGGGGGGNTPRPPGGGAPGAGGARPPGGPAAPGTDEPGKGQTELEKNQEFDFEFIEDKEADYHRQSVASLFAEME